MITRTICARQTRLAADARWRATRLGRFVAAREQRFCDRVAASVRGHFAVQLGALDLPLIRRCSARHHAVVGRAPGCAPRADWREMPFANDSLDFVVAAHAFEFCEDPRALAREIARVLRPEGDLLVVAFNPLSLFGARAKIDRGGEYPWRGRFLPLPQIRDWLALLGLSPVGGGYCAYLPPLALRQESKCALGWVEAAGARWWPLAGGVYFIHAVKRVIVARADFARVACAKNIRAGDATGGARGVKMRGAQMIELSESSPDAPARRVEIFTDGSCLGNPGPGGWGAVLRWRGREKRIAGGEAATTNNRMELTAAIRALESLRGPCAVVLTTDSQYLRRGVTEWLAAWRRREWRAAGGGKIKNIDLWQRLHDLVAAHQIDWRWTKGHAECEGNQVADALARDSARTQCR